MKKRISTFLVSLLLLLSGCGGEAKDVHRTTTVMIYMVGSDLEAKSGAGTKDLEEMAASGVDLSKVNVLVYAGGSPKWHNAQADPEKHTLLRLTENGFEKVAELDAYSMGEAQCLGNFLSYSHSNFPAQQYALILWDHGNGPVIGYGKDMLYGNDCLTLQEMRTALEASPFGQEQKLVWVGFDACLMASAELACLWAPYAEYLVASQEIEPAFGWDYGFLSGVSTANTPGLMETLAQGYMDACLAYYEQRGYEDRDTTLSCVDLRYAAQLEQALDALFSRAGEDVQTQYNQLTARRAQTRALGRASTGSEYDLVDLSDMSMWLGQLYPQEVLALQAVLEKMVICNATNAQSLCGMSLYYPFYNKTYYEKDWAAAYQALGLFEQYRNYLKEYERLWLKNDLLDTVAASTMPQQVTEHTYSLQLTAQQAETLASARYYILKQEGEELYTVLFAGANVSRQGDLLVAGFDGQILYATNDLWDYVIPVSAEHDTVGDITRYSAYVYLDNSLSLLVQEPEDYAYQSGGYRFHLAVNNTSKEISVSALVPHDQELDADILTGGKIEDVDLSEWTTYTFPSLQHRYLTRYENGTVCPVDQWPAAGLLSAYEMRVRDGLDFVYAPLDAGTYCLMFELEDTQGNRYCSEMLPIEKQPEQTPVTEEPPVGVAWSGSDRLVLLEQDGVTIFLEQLQDDMGTNCVIGVQNQTDRAVLVSAEDLFVNETVFCPDAVLGSVEAQPGQTARYDRGFDWGTVGDLGVPAQLEQIQFYISMEESLSRRTLLRDQAVIVQLEEGTALTPTADSWSESKTFGQPVRGMLAGEQLLTRTEDVQITLLGLGGSSNDGAIQGAVEVQNCSDAMLYAQVLGLVLDGVYIPAPGAGLEIPPGCATYSDILCQQGALDQAGLTDIRSAVLVVRYDQQETMLGLGGFSTVARYPVQLTQSGGGSAIPEGGQLLFEEQGIRVLLLSYEGGPYSDYWYVLVENSGQQDICLDMSQCVINGQAYPDDEYIGNSIFDGAVGAGEKTIARLAFINFDGLELEQLSFRLRVMDFTQQKTLFTGQTEIVLTVPAES